MAGDKLGDEVRRLLAEYYAAAADPERAAEIAAEILDRMRPILKRWTQTKSNDPMQDAEDFYVEAQEQLVEELRKSLAGRHIDDVFSYAKTMVMRLHLMRLRKKRPFIVGEIPFDMPGSGAEEGLQVDYEAAWKALSECGIKGRAALLLALEREDIFAWVGLPDACPAFAAMLEMDESPARALWKQLPLCDEVIAGMFDTTVAYIQKLRSLVKAKLRRLLFGK